MSNSCAEIKWEQNISIIRFVFMGLLGEIVCSGVGTSVLILAWSITLWINCMCLEAIWSTSGCSCVSYTSAVEKHGWCQQQTRLGNKQEGFIFTKIAFSVEERETVIIPIHYISWTSTWFCSPHLRPFRRQQFSSLLINILLRSIGAAEGPSKAGGRWLLSLQSFAIVVTVELTRRKSWTLAARGLTTLWQTEKL